MVKKRKTEPAEIQEVLALSRAWAVNKVSSLKQACYQRGVWKSAADKTQSEGEKCQTSLSSAWKWDLLSRELHAGRHGNRARRVTAAQPAGVDMTGAGSPAGCVSVFRPFEGKMISNSSAADGEMARRRRFTSRPLPACVGTSWQVAEGSCSQLDESQEVQKPYSSRKNKKHGGHLLYNITNKIFRVLYLFVLQNK